MRLRSLPVSSPLAAASARSAQPSRQNAAPSRNRCLVLLLTLLAILPLSCRAGLYRRSASADDVKVVDIGDYGVFHGILQSDQIWMFHVVAPDLCASQGVDCNDHGKHFVSLAHLASGIFHVGAVDAGGPDASRMLEDLGHRADDASGVYVYAGDREPPKRYEGPIDTQEMIQEIMETALDTLRKRAGHYERLDWDAEVHRKRSRRKKRTDSTSGGGGKVAELTSESFRRRVLKNPRVSIVAFTAPWCGHCKNLRPTWNDIAAQLEQDEVVVGWLDATAETDIAQQFRVQSYPTIKLFKGSANDSNDDDFDVVDYTGERSASAVSEFVLQTMARYGITREVPEMTDATTFRDECGGANHICIMAALPHILDSGADGRNKYKQLVDSVSAMFRASTFSFLWYEGPSQPGLEQSFGLTFGYPTVVAYTIDRGAFAVMRGSFTKKSITSFLYGLTNGRQATTKISSVPEVAATEPWDGKDGEVIEEELSLAEIMGWDDEDGVDKGDVDEL